MPRLTTLGRIVSAAIGAVFFLIGFVGVENIRGTTVATISRVNECDNKQVNITLGTPVNVLRPDGTFMVVRATDISVDSVTLGINGAETTLIVGQGLPDPKDAECSLVVTELTSDGVVTEYQCCR